MNFSQIPKKERELSCSATAWLEKKNGQNRAGGVLLIFYFRFFSICSIKQDLSYRIFRRFRSLMQHLAHLERRFREMSAAGSQQVATNFNDITKHLSPPEAYRNAWKACGETVTTIFGCHYTVEVWSLAGEPHILSSYKALKAL
jgi:hypothetical protein